MIAKVSFVPQATAEKMPGARSEVLISITQPGDSADLNTGWRDVLKLAFDDVDSPQPGCRLFSEKDAEQVIRFVERYASEVTHVVVHCHAGISRSAAVAKFLAEQYGCAYPAQYPLYNKAVYRMLVRVQRGDAQRQSAFGDIVLD